MPVEATENHQRKVIVKPDSYFMFIEKVFSKRQILYHKDINRYYIMRWLLILNNKIAVEYEEINTD